jgi:hypothetical protein
MSMPDIPDKIRRHGMSRQDANNLLLVSIAMEEMALSHILNAQGEKIQHALAGCMPREDWRDLEESIGRTLSHVIKKELLLLLKLEEVLESECRCCDCDEE